MTKNYKVQKLVVGELVNLGSVEPSFIVAREGNGVYTVRYKGNLCKGISRQKLGVCYHDGGSRFSFRDGPKNGSAFAPGF